MSNGIQKAYLGDGVYAADNGWEILIETERENGRSYIYLDDAVLDSLLRLVERTRGLKIRIERETTERKSE